MDVVVWTGREAQALRKAMRLTIQGFAEMLGVAERTVANWEAHGSRTKPRPFQQSMLDTTWSRTDPSVRDRFVALLATTDSALPADDHRSREHTQLSTLLDLDLDDEQPAVVRQATIVQLASSADLLTRWDFERGALAVRPAAVAQVRWARSLLDLPCPAHLRRELHAAVARLALIAGFMNFDAHAQDRAAKIFAFASACSEEAGDPHLQVKALSHRARQMTYCGTPVESLPLFDRALALRGATATELAMLHTGRARALAKLGRVADAVAAVAAADDAFARSDRSEDPSWMAYYDLAQHQGDTGHAYFDLAVEGLHEREAISRLSAAVTGHSASYARSRAMSMTKLSSVLMAVGDPIEAAALAEGALPAVSEIGTERVLGLLRELLRYSTAHRRIGEVEQLRLKIAEIVA